MELGGMEGRASREFRSRSSALAWFFRKSRDNWKSKYQAVRQTLRSFRAELRDVRHSREKWRSQAEALKEENRLLRAQVECGRSEASDRPPPPAPSMARLGKAR